MQQRFDFEDIRPLYDEEVPEVIESLLKEPAVEQLFGFVAPGIPLDALKQQLLGMKTKRDFQIQFIAPLLFKLAEKTTTSLDIGGTELLSQSESYTFMSNHRDIVLDAAFLNILLYSKGFDTVEVAIGDNLLVYPWIRNLVRLNKSFIVKRNMPVRQMLEVSRRLSSYIHYALKIKGQSIWISQREGRAKDSIDRTQSSVIKMLAMGGGKDLRASIRSLNISPVAISYEYDPCDYLKAQEFQLKRDDPEYKKTQADDLLNMKTGMVDFKGRVHFQVAGPITEAIDALPVELEKTDLVNAVTELVDQAIHSNLRMYSGNYVAYDLLYNTDKHVAHYTAEEKATFETYLSGQLAKIQIPNKDEAFLRERLLTMYANPLANYERANQIAE